MGGGEDRTKRISKTLSHALRHEPPALGLVLDERGFAPVDRVLAALESRGLVASRADLELLADPAAPRRFELSPDGSRIRATHGHSIPVDLGYDEARPPEILFHGTVARFLESIRAGGLEKGERRFVHLSENRTEAARVGGRRGKPVILEVRAGNMADDGHRFFRSGGGVWLVEHVPADYLVFPPR